MSIMECFASGMALLILIGIVRGASSNGEQLDEDDPNQFFHDELDSRNSNNLMLRNHPFVEEHQDPFIHDNSQGED